VSRRNLRMGFARMTLDPSRQLRQTRLNRRKRNPMREAGAATAEALSNATKTVGREIADKTWDG
jgi:hypothetical protein